MSKLDYKIPKIQVKVDIMIDEGTLPHVEAYTLYLDEFSRYRTGPETLFEFLNKTKEREFIPIKHAGTGEFLILKSDEIVYVLESEKSSTQSAQKVILYLKNNIHLEVDHFNPLPDSQSRVLDYLNQDVKFILFYYEQRKIFINKNKIIRVKER